ncbi:hypothetical protein HPB47_008301 [Ixodes persulcatus]|uniref:Uncharacterized protein n=1 Tax=Ixodes persulcatus TaxID=34615 RepID=A0AC60P554_IXOPE|nr:hypothetical protein HPB47_008301 [Ixodes persulcatus]
MSGRERSGQFDGKWGEGAPRAGKPLSCGESGCVAAIEGATRVSHEAASGRGGGQGRGHDACRRAFLTACSGYGRALDDGGDVDPARSPRSTGLRPFGRPFIPDRTMGPDSRDLPPGAADRADHRLSRTSPKTRKRSSFAPRAPPRAPRARPPARQGLPVTSSFLRTSGPSRNFDQTAERLIRWSKHECPLRPFERASLSSPRAVRVAGEQALSRLGAANWADVPAR